MKNKLTSIKFYKNLEFKELKELGKIRAEHISVNSFSKFYAKKRSVQPLLAGRNKFLLKELLPLKEKRMAKDIFSFYRGTVDLMRMDLKKYQSSNIDVLICGDAHIMNFGFYASPERELMFDINDFDEVEVNSWEHDVKRFIVSVLLLSDQIFSKKEKEVKKFLRKSLDIYRKTLTIAYESNALNRLLIPNSVENIINIFGKTKDGTLNLLKSSIEDVKVKGSDFSVEKYTYQIGNSRKFIESAPLTKAVSRERYQLISDSFQQYKEQLPKNIQLSLTSFSIIDIIRHTVGVGSVGSRCYLVLLKHVDGTYLVLQIKEALPIIRANTEISKKQASYRSHEVINSQMILQSATDPFLGSFTMKKRSYYIRQFKDMKGSINLKKLDWDSYIAYIQTCMMLLARSHSQSPNFPMIIGFLEKNTWIDEAILSFCTEYKKQVVFDYYTFLKEKKKK